MITFDELRHREDIRTYITRADESLEALGFTEHSFAHVTRVAVEAGRLLSELGFSERTAELARIREVKGISETDAKAVYDYFHGGKEE